MFVYTIRKVSLLSFATICFLHNPSTYNMCCVRKNIFEATTTNDITFIQELIAARADVNQKNAEGETPLHIASQLGHIEIMAALIKAGANVNQPSIKGISPLMMASWGERLMAVETLIATGADINQQNSWDCTALHYAASNGNLAIVQKLIAAGAHVDMQDREGQTPLYNAINYRHLETTQALIAAGANVNHNMHDNPDETPLRLAIYSGHIAIVQTLINAGANINHQERFTEETLLHIAAQYQNPAIAQALIAAGANVNQQDRTDWQTPLVRAIMWNRPKTAQALIAAGANVNQQGLRCWQGETPLHIAVKIEDLEIVQILIAEGADPELKNSHSETPLICASESYRTNNSDIKDFLIRYPYRAKAIRAKTPKIGFSLAMALHQRLGIASPLQLLSQNLLHDIAKLTTEAELYDTTTAPNDFAASVEIETAAAIDEILYVSRHIIEGCIIS